MSMVHLWNHCHNCNAAPIVGSRYECTECPTGPDNDLCASCFRLFEQGKIAHPAENTPNAALFQGKDTSGHIFNVHEGRPADGFADWLKVGQPTAFCPPLRHPFVVRPIFNGGGDAAIGSYAFAASVEKDGCQYPLLFTALHVMDHLIKLAGIDCTDGNAGYTGAELPSLVTGVNLFDVFAANWMMAPLGTAGPMLTLPDARLGDEEPESYRDIAAFRLHSDALDHLRPLPLARQAPGIGEPVWLITLLPGQTGQQSLQAVVVESTGKILVFKYADPDKRPQYASGSPLVNRSGEIAGILVGGGQLEDQRLGHACHAGNIKNHLEISSL